MGVKKDCEKNAVLNLFIHASSVNDSTRYMHGREAKGEHYADRALVRLVLREGRYVQHRLML